MGRSIDTAWGFRLLNLGYQRTSKSSCIGHYLLKVNKTSCYRQFPSTGRWDQLLPVVSSFNTTKRQDNASLSFAEAGQKICQRFNPDFNLIAGDGTAASELICLSYNRSGYAQRWSSLAIRTSEIRKFVSCGWRNLLTWHYSTGGIGRRSVELLLKLQLAIPSCGSAVACLLPSWWFGIEQESSIQWRLPEGWAFMGALTQFSNFRFSHPLRCERSNPLDYTSAATCAFTSPSHPSAIRAGSAPGRPSKKKGTTSRGFITGSTNFSQAEHWNKWGTSSFGHTA